MKYLIQKKEHIFGKTAAKAARNSDKTAMHLYYMHKNLIWKYKCLEFATLIWIGKHEQSRWSLSSCIGSYSTICLSAAQCCPSEYFTSEKINKLTAHVFRYIVVSAFLWNFTILNTVLFYIQINKMLIQELLLWLGLFCSRWHFWTQFSAHYRLIHSPQKCLLSLT